MKQLFRRKDLQIALTKMVKVRKHSGLWCLAPLRRVDLERREERHRMRVGLEYEFEVKVREWGPGVRLDS